MAWKSEIEILSIEIVPFSLNLETASIRFYEKYVDKLHSKGSLAAMIGIFNSKYDDATLYIYKLTGHSFFFFLIFHKIKIYSLHYRQISGLK